MSLKQVNNNTEVDERLVALINNSNAIRTIASSVEGTIGPKGLDTMLVDKFGEVVITNDGVTILDLMEVNHPAARMLINIAKAQQEEIGDGTTTATLMAGALVGAGVEQVIKGVPVVKVIEGLRAGVRRALAFFEEISRTVDDLDDPLLSQIALVAGRENQDIADLAVQAAGLMGIEKLRDPYFRLSEMVRAQMSAENEVFSGLIINKGRMNRQMPREVTGATVLVVDDALEAEEVEEEALGTETGVARYLALQEEFKTNLNKLVGLGVKVVLVDRGADDLAEEILSDAGVIIVHRVPNKELRQAAEHTGARVIKRTGLKKGIEELRNCLGYARRVYEDEKLEQVRILGGGGKPVATILVGASTEEVVGERERIARDAAASVQAAVRGGVVPGGGSVELAAGRVVERMRQEVRGMTAYGIDCVVEALKRPFTQIVANAGFNPLEKLGDVLTAQTESNQEFLAIDCDTGNIADMLELGVVDPTLVKKHALKAAGEVAEAILRINMIIKKKENMNNSRVGSGDPEGF
ncbi:MAG: TCP-1/cpn60 chaperonin family protein [Bacillota bacterium]